VVPLNHLTSINSSFILKDNTLYGITPCSMRNVVVTALPEFVGTFITLISISLVKPVL
jgi:hypothetical protein